MIKVCFIVVGFAAFLLFAPGARADVTVDQSHGQSGSPEVVSILLP
jgi:hypothetical protein